MASDTQVKELTAIKTTRSGLERSKEQLNAKLNVMSAKTQRTKQEEAELLRLRLELARLNNQDWKLKDRQQKIELALRNPG